MGEGLGPEDCQHKRPGQLEGWLEVREEEKSVFTVPWTPGQPSASSSPLLCEGAGVCEACVREIALVTRSLAMQNLTLNSSTEL